MSLDNDRAKCSPAVRNAASTAKLPPTKKEQSRLSQFAYRQRQKALAKVNQMELARLATASRTAQAQAAHAQAEVAQLRTLANTLKVTQVEMDRLASAAAAPFLAAAAAQAQADEFARNAAMVAYNSEQQKLTAAAMSEAAALRGEVEHLNSLLWQQQTQQQQALQQQALQHQVHQQAQQQRHALQQAQAQAQQPHKWQDYVMSSGIACEGKADHQAEVVVADRQEAEIVAAFELLMARLQLLHSPRPPAEAEVDGSKERATARLLVMKGFAKQLYADLVSSTDQGLDDSRACSGSVDTTEHAPIIAEPQQSPIRGRWRTVVPSPFSTAISSPDGWGLPGASLSTDQTLEESASDPLITLWSVASRCESQLLTDGIYGSFHV